jgi:hypothetical protein
MAGPPARNAAETAAVNRNRDIITFFLQKSSRHYRLNRFVNQGIAVLRCDKPG